MKRQLVLVLYVGLLLSGCTVHQDNEQYVRTKTLEYNGTDIYKNKFTAPVLGDFYVTYIPIQFVETEDVRKARDQYIRAHINTELSSRGLTPSDVNAWADAIFGKLERPFYEIQYYYNTTPSWYPEDRGWHHEMSISIFDMGKKRECVWEGRTWIECWIDKDISGLLSWFIGRLFEDFPNRGRQKQVNQRPQEQKDS